MYLEQESAVLVSETKEFTDAVKAGDVAQAKAEFTNARVHYESIEPVAESFGDLDPEIDAREGDVPDAEWGGFHRIEKQLWVDGNTTGMAPVADKLLTDVKELQAKIPGIDLEPAQIANGAVELLNEVAKSKVTGEEDRYSHTDLYDFAANVDRRPGRVRCSRSGRHGEGPAASGRGEREVRGGHRGARRSTRTATDTCSTTR